MSIPPLGVFCVLSLMRKYPIVGPAVRGRAYDIYAARGLSVSGRLLRSIAKTNNQNLLRFFLDNLDLLEKHFDVPSLLFGQVEFKCAECKLIVRPHLTKAFCIMHYRLPSGGLRQMWRTPTCHRCCVSLHDNCNEIRRASYIRQNLTRKRSVRES
jgi:hypothetical protein